MDAVDDSSGSIGGATSEIIELIHSLSTSSDSPRPLLSEIFDFVEKELPDDSYFGYGEFGWELLSIYRDLALSLGEKDKFLAFIELKLSRLNGPYDGYDRSSLIKTKIDFLKEIGLENEVQRTVEQNMDVVEVREGVVAQAISQNDYKQAKELIAKGIKLAQEERLPGVVSRWEEKMLHIAVLQGDTNEIRRLAKQFAFDHYHSSKEHYRQWRETYSKEEWERIIERHIQETITQTTKEWKNSKTYWKPQRPDLLSALSGIFIEEGYLDRLFELVKEEKMLDDLLQYHTVLKSAYADELIVLYVPALEAYGHKTSSRAEYADLVNKMQNIIKDIPQGRERILDVARSLKNVYSTKPRRPAMLEELGKLI